MQYWVLTTNIYAVFCSSKRLSYILSHCQGKNLEGVTYPHLLNEETENGRDLIYSSKVAVPHGLWMF